MAKQGELIERESSIPAAPQHAPSILEIVQRAAADPQTDVTKMERLLEMARQMKADEAKVSYFAALSEMQDELPIIAERGEIKISENKKGQKYAFWADINTAIKPIMKRHGFALSFRTGQQDAKITITGVLSHKDGHSEETTIHLPSDTSGSKNAVQAVGSSTSYGKRYVTGALLNLTYGDEKDDGGQAAGGNLPISDDQLDHITNLLSETNSDIPRFCKFMGVNTVPELRAKDYEKAVKTIQAKARK